MTSAGITAAQAMLLLAAADWVQEQQQTMAGESWGQGQVILAWVKVIAGAADQSDGRNVALHEFAHQFDQDSGLADGRPSAAKKRRWARGMAEAFDEHSTLKDPYGASDPADFFTVVSELLERSQELEAEAPAVYGELAELYGLSRAGWRSDRARRRNRVQPASALRRHRNAESPWAAGNRPSGFRNVTAFRWWDTVAGRANFLLMTSSRAVSIVTGRMCKCEATTRSDAAKCVGGGGFEAGGEEALRIR